MDFPEFRLVFFHQIMQKFLIVQEAKNRNFESSNKSSTLLLQKNMRFSHDFQNQNILIVKIYVEERKGKMKPLYKCSEISDQQKFVRSHFREAWRC